MPQVLADPQSPWCASVEAARAGPLGETRRRVARDVERDALTVKGALSKRISLSMTQPAPRIRFYIAHRSASRATALIERSGLAAFH